MIDKLKDRLAVEVERMADAANAYPWEDRRAYANYLSQTYFYVAHSTRLLAAATSRFPLEDENLHRRFLGHAVEEKSHHFLALHDLRALGHVLDDFPEHPATRALWEPQYYKVTFQDPIAFFGYVLALEGLGAAIAGTICARLEPQYGASATTFLKVHANVEADHLKKAFDQLATLAEVRLGHIEANLVQTSHSFVLFLDFAGRIATAR